MIVVFFFLVIILAVEANRFTLSQKDVEDYLTGAVANKTFPGAVYAVCSWDDATSGFKLQFQGAVGRLEYVDGSPAMTKDTSFDLASLTKVVATTSAVMLLVQDGHLGLDDVVASPELLGAAFSSHGKGEITVRHLLTHSAGFPADPVPGYSDVRFGCQQGNPPPRTFDCMDAIYASLLNQTLSHPAGDMMLYSDLSMITLMFVIGKVVRDNALVKDSPLSWCPLSNDMMDSHVTCHYVSFLQSRLLSPLGMTSTSFNPSGSLQTNAAPTWRDEVYQKRLMRGFVSDANAYAMGGVSGHAGLFSVVGDLVKFIDRLVTSPEAPTDGLFDKRTLSLFTKVPAKGRFLGWSADGDCGGMGADSYTHTGYTGTQICIDPSRQIATILLTNRCNPDDSKESKEKIKEVRKGFNALVVTAADSAEKSPPVRKGVVVAFAIFAFVVAVGLVAFAVVLVVRSNKAKDIAVERELRDLDNSFSPITGEEDEELL